MATAACSPTAASTSTISREKATFEEVCFLLWHRRLPTRAELGDLQTALAAARPLPEPIVRLLRSLPQANGMDVLRTVTSALAHYDPDADDQLRGGELSQGGPAHRAAREPGRDLWPPERGWRADCAGSGARARRELPLHADRRTGPNATAVRAFDIALTLHADHELNASTFAARVTAATLSDVHSAVVSGIGALKGPLHGGANADVMKLLLELGQDASTERIESTIRAKLARKEKIPGFGHRVYHTEDPRATHLRRMSKELGERAGNPRWFAMSQTIEALVKAEKKLNPNVDFYSASTYYTLGIPIDLFTPIFAVSRVSGWTAHVLEQYANNRLIRPRADYTGPPPPQPWIPLDRR